MIKVLIVEDDMQIAKSLTMNLQFSGYEVHSAQNFQSGWKKFSEQDLDLLLLDINLPDGTGLDFCKRVREAGSDVPILFLSARTDEETVVEGMNIGADDYLRKPFGTEELKVRMKKALSKSGVKRRVLVAGPITIDLAKRTVTLYGNTLTLGRREFDILTIIAQKPGDIVSRENILKFLGERADIYDRTIDSHMSHLRKKISEASNEKVKIASVYGVGYKLDLSLVANE
jgi:DNA-binding response OmpR family regulator